MGNVFVRAIVCLVEANEADGANAMDAFVLALWQLGRATPTELEWIAEGDRTEI
jgi:hypothetical protein